MIILDTNVLSELMRPKPAPVVVRWISGQPASRLFTTTVSQAEVLLGVALLPAGKRRDALETAAEAVFREDFAGRVLPFGGDAASYYALIAAARRARGRPITPFDAQIAAIARTAGATLATRNTADFDGCGIELSNPWESD